MPKMQLKINEKFEGSMMQNVVTATQNTAMMQNIWQESLKERYYNKSESVKQRVLNV